MKNTKGLCWIILGAMLLLTALSLVFYNLKEDNESGETASKILAELKLQIPEPATNSENEDFLIPDGNDLFKEYETPQETTETESLIEIDGNYYIGTISIPKLGIELPVLSEWSYPNLKLSPCRYKGTVAGGDLIIAAHNYRSHFGRIQELSSGDILIFTDANGNIHQYEVIQTDMIDGYNVESMEFGSADSWDLTLFTCTLSGQSRVTVRAIEVK